MTDMSSIAGQFVSGVLPPSAGSLEGHWFVWVSGELLVREDEGAALPSLEELSGVQGGDLKASAHYLGALDGTPCFAAALGADQPAPRGFAPVGLRPLFGRLSETLWMVAGRAAQIVEWDRTHRFCGACAAPTERVPHERARQCPSCNLHFYPRLSPAIIVLVRRGEEALLGHGKRFPIPIYSTLAGFVEPGETLEETLAREVREEVGVEVKDIRYFGSQPWPFPHSLMVGFNATYAGGELQVNADELQDAKWFRFDALPRLPPRPSIARRLIDAWIEDCSRAAR
jgi:NAD+ diphosphatase